MNIFKNISIFVILLIVSITGVLTTQAGGPPLKADTHIMKIDKLEGLNEEPKFDFEINSSDDLRRLQHVLYKYYNTYVKRTFHSEDTTELEEKITQVQDKIHEYNHFEQYNSYRYSIDTATSQAGHDLIVDLGYSSGQIGIFLQESEIHTYKDNVFWYGDLYSQTDIFRVIKPSDDYNVNMPVLIFKEDVENFLIQESNFKNVSEPAYDFTNLESLEDVSEYIESEGVSEYNLFEVAYYIEENGTYIKIPTYANYVFDSSRYIVDVADEIEIEVDETEIGIGVSYNEYGTYRPYISQVLPGGPAESAGLRVGDVILRTDGEDIINDSYSYQLLKLGKKDTEIELTILRDFEELNFTVSISEYSTKGIDYTLQDYNGYTSTSENEKSYESTFLIDNYNPSDEYYFIFESNKYKAEFKRYFDIDGNLNEGFREKKIEGGKFTISKDELIEPLEGEFSGFSGRVFIKRDGMYYYGGKVLFNIFGTRRAVMVNLGYEEDMSYKSKVETVLDVYKEKVGEEKFKITLEKLQPRVEELYHKKYDEGDTLLGRIRSQKELEDNKEKILQTLANIDMLDVIKNYIGKELGNGIGDAVEIISDEELERLAEDAVEAATEYNGE